MQHPTTSATTSICGKVSTSRAQASGRDPSATARIRSLATSTRCLRQRSTQAPAGSPITRKARNSQVASSPISKASASSTFTASTGIASIVSWVPNWLSESPMNSCRKSWWRNSPPRRRVGGSGSAGGAPRAGARGCRGFDGHEQHPRLTDWEISISWADSGYGGAMDTASGRRRTLRWSRRRTVRCRSVRAVRPGLGVRPTRPRPRRSPRRCGCGSCGSRCTSRAPTRRSPRRSGMNPASVLHHVRTLVDTGFLIEQPVRRGPRGSRERPYLASGKTWYLDGRATPPSSAAGGPPAQDVPRRDRASCRRGCSGARGSGSGSSPPTGNGGGATRRGAPRDRRHPQRPGRASRGASISACTRTCPRTDAAGVTGSPS